MPKRIRVEITDRTYDGLRYFGLLRGVPISTVVSKILSIWEAEIERDFPMVRAHTMARMQSRGEDVPAEPSDDTETVEPVELPF